MLLWKQSEDASQKLLRSVSRAASQWLGILRKANWVVGSTPRRSINRPRQTDTRRSNTIDNTDVMEKVGSWQQRRTVDPLE